MQKIIILDYTSLEVLVIPYDNEGFQDAEDFLEKLEENEVISRVSQCNWLVVEELILKIQNI